MALFITLYNRLMLALYARRNGGMYKEYCTPLEAFISSGCIGQPTADMWQAHKLARSVGPMPKQGAGYVGPNFSYPGF